MVRRRFTDEDVQAKRRRIELFFAETPRRKELQAILIKRVYFADDLRSVEATREGWTREPGAALIPLDWPIREDEQNL